MMLKWTMLIIGILLLKEISSCEITSPQDIQDTVRLSNMTYYDIKKGPSDIPGYTIQKVIEKSGRHGDTLKAVIAKKVDPPTIMVCFEGTTSLEQLVHQAHSAASQPWVDIIIKGRKMKVMKYYWDALKALDVENVVEKRNDTKYLFTGHSLGGALASLFALTMTEIHNGDMWKHPGSRLITFGQPRIGDKAFAKAHDDLIAPFKKLRLVYNKDVVPHVPSRSLNFMHASTEIWINREVHHKLHIDKCSVHGWDLPCGFDWEHYYLEVWKVCPEGDGGNTCSYGKKSIHGREVGVRVFSKRDHRAITYVKAVANLIKDKDETEQFVQQQCNYIS